MIKKILILSLFALTLYAQEYHFKGKVSIDTLVTTILVSDTTSDALKKSDSTLYATQTDLAEITVDADSSVINDLVGTYLDTVSSDTMSISWGVLDTVFAGSLSGWKVPTNITIIEVSGYTDANTCTFNLEERGEATPNTAGTDVLTSDLVADNDQQESTTFSNSGIAKDTWLVPTISATGDVSIFTINVRYIKQ